MEMNVNFKQIENAGKYVNNLLSSGADVIRAEKSSCVIAHQATVAGPVDTYTASGLHEVAEYADVGDWVVTRADLEGKPVLNGEGKPNTWVIKNDTFKKKYDVANMRDDGFTKPKGGVQSFVRISEDISIMVPWGKDGALVPQNLEAGAVLNITNMNDIYGIAKDEFAETYAIIK